MPKAIRSDIAYSCGFSSATGSLDKLVITELVSERQNHRMFIAPMNEASSEMEAQAAALRDRILATIRRRTGNEVLAEDVAQETLLRVIDRIRHRGLDDPSKLTNFTYRVAANVLREFRRDNRIQSDNDKPDSTESDHDGPYDVRSRAEESRIVWQVLDDMGDEGYRDILVRHIVRDQDKGEICQELGLSRRQFTQRLHRAKRQFSKTMRKAQREGRLHVVE